MRVREKVGGGVWITAVLADNGDELQALLAAAPPDIATAVEALTYEMDYLLVVESGDDGLRVRCYPQHGSASERGYGVQLSYEGFSLHNILRKAWVDAQLISARKCSYRVTARELPVAVP